MKELSIEQKAKAYDEALKRARQFSEHPLQEDSSNIVEYIFPELKESEDEKIRKEILHFIKKRDRSGCDYDYDKWIAWLEKQDKKETLCDKCRKEHPSHSCQDITALGRCALEKQDEQKPADKVEPKFKFGDWITTTDEEGNVTTEKIIEFCGDKVRLIDINGFYSLWPKHELNYYHLWTIQDAKDGDVLHSPSHHIIWIYKDNEHCHACVNMNYVTENTATNNQIFIPNDTCPATKDEQTILFANMEEAGYMWDADKRVLKKIEQKPAENKGMNLVEEDMTPFQKKVFCIIDTAIEEEQGLKQVCEELLRLAHDEIMQKPAWSEEDEDAIGMAIIALEDMYDEDAPNTTYGGYNLPFNKAAERLKSLKDRYTWKPSDEQMQMLHRAIEVKAPGVVRDGLESLYNDLKNL